MLSQRELDWFAARLSIAVYDTNRETPEMAMWELQQAFPGLQTITTTKDGRQILHFEDRDLEVGPMASNAEIAAALQNPFIRTENTKMSISGYEPGAIRARLEAIKKTGKDRRDAAIAKLDEAGKKHEQVSEEIERVATAMEKEAEAALQEFSEFSNGGPA
jgi:DNA anti-recombination protein RmuC